MRILHIIPDLQIGGAERLAIDICRETNKRKGHSAALMLLSKRNEYQYLTQDLPVYTTSSHVTLSLLGKTKIDLNNFNAFIENYKPDVIHSHLFAAEIFSRQNIYSACRYFTHCHDNMPQMRNFSLQTLYSKKGVTNFFEKQQLLKKYLQCNNRFIAISRHTEKYFKSVLPSSLQKNIFLLDNAIDFQKFHQGGVSRSFKKISIVNVGSFVPKKNQELFISIAKELMKRKIDFEITLLGNGPLYQDVKQQVEQHQLTGKIFMPGNVGNVEKYYAGANLYVHTATYEPFGLVLLEAMAAGLPVVTLDGGGNRDLLQQGINGFLIEEPNGKLFADTIDKIFQEKRYSKISENAINFARSFDITTYTDKLLKLYEFN